MELKTKHSPTVMQPCAYCSTLFKPTNGWHKYCKRQCKWLMDYKINPRPGGRPRTEEQKQRKRLIQKTYYEKNKEQIREKERERNRAKIKHGPCPICLTDTRLVYDHNHATGERRLYICNLCNLALGHTREDVNVLKNLINYLEKEPWKNI